MHDNLIILAGGASSRMKKQVTVANLSEEEIAQANERSKGLIGVGPNGRPLLDFLLLNAKKAGYKNIYIIIGEQGDLFKEFYGSKTLFVFSFFMCVSCMRFVSLEGVA